MKTYILNKYSIQQINYNMNNRINSNQQPVPFNVLTQTRINQITQQPTFFAQHTRSRPRTATKNASQAISPKSHNLIYVQRQSIRSGKHPLVPSKHLQKDIKIIVQAQKSIKRKVMDQTTMSSSMGFRQQRVNRKFHQGAGTAAASVPHTQIVTAESSPSKRTKSKARKQAQDPQNNVYSSQDQGRSSIGASYSQHSKSNPAQFSAVKMSKSYAKNKDLSPRQVRMLVNQSQQSQKQGRYLASSNQHSYLNNLKDQVTQSSFGGGRIAGTSLNHKRNLVKKQPHLQNSRGAFDSDSASGRNGSQATQKLSKHGIAQLDVDSRYTLQGRDSGAHDYLRQQQHMYQLNQIQESRSSSKKNAQSAFGATRMQNAKSIGLFDLRKHLKKNTKRVLSSKQRAPDSDVDMFLAAAHADPVIGLVEGQKSAWAFNQGNPALNPSLSGHLEQLPPSSMTLSNKNLHANTEAATMTTTGYVAPLAERNTISAFQGKTKFNSLENEYIMTLQRNQRMCANSQFDKFLQEKFLANEAQRRVKVDKSTKDKFIIRVNANKVKERQGSNIISKHSLSPLERELQQDFDQESKRPSFQTGTTKSPISNAGHRPAQAQKKRQIDTNQMLSDLRQSIKARDSNVVRDVQRAENLVSIGEKMSLTGEADTMKAKIFNMSTLDNREKQLSQHSDVETYSSKQYKINPLLLDEQILKQVQQPPSEPSHDFAKDQKKRNKNTYAQKEMRKLRASFNENYHVVEDNQQSLHKGYPPEPGKEPVVLQLEPRTLADRSSTLNTSMNLNQMPKPTQFNEYLKVDDLQKYKNQLEIDQSSNEHEYTQKRGAGGQIVMNQRDVLKNQMLNRPGSLRSKNAKWQGAVRQKDASVVVKTTPHTNLNNKNDNNRANYGVQDQFMNKRLKKITGANLQANRRRIAAGHESFEVDLKKKFLPGRPAEVERHKNQELQVVSSETLTPELRSMVQKKQKMQNEMMRPVLRERGLQYSNTALGQLSQGVPVQNELDPRSTMFLDGTGLSRIKRANLQKVKGKLFKEQRLRSAKKQSASLRHGPYKNHKSYHALSGNPPLGMTNLHAQMNEQAIAPQIVNQIHQNSSGFLDREMSAIAREEYRNRSIPNATKTMRKSQSQSKTHTGTVTPNSRSANRANAMARQRNHDSEQQLQFIRNESGKSLRRPSGRKQQQNILDIRIKNASTPDRAAAAPYPEQSFDRVVLDGQRALSNHDYSSPAQDKRYSGDRSSGESGTAERQRSQSLRKIKYKSKNTKSETFLYTKSRNRSQISNPDSNQVNPGRERCDVVVDAQVAALNYIYPKTYQSVMNGRSAERPSLREHLQRSGKRPANQRPQQALSEYPQFEREVRESAGTYTAYAKSLYQAVGVNNNRRRATSAKAIDIRGLKYKFKVVDIAKYTDTLKYGIFNWPVRYCTIGRKLPNPIERKETLVKEIHFDTLLRILKETDWMKTPLYMQFKKHGRWINDDEEIYSEIEINYLSSTLHQMDKGDNVEEFNETEGQAIIKKHWGKTISTLQKLMSMMNMMYYYEKLKLQFSKLEAPGNPPKIDHLEKLLSRCKKLYNQIDSFMKIFKLIELKQKRDHQKNLKKGEVTDKDLKKDEILIKRLIVAICLLLKENPVLPLSFKFGGDCLLQQLKREKEELRQLRLERKQGSTAAAGQPRTQIQLNPVPFENLIEEIDKNVYVKTRRSLESLEDGDEPRHRKESSVVITEQAPAQVHTNF